MTGYYCKCLKIKAKICIIKNPLDDDCTHCKKPDIYMGKPHLSKKDLIIKELEKKYQEKYYKNNVDK